MQQMSIKILEVLGEERRGARALIRHGASELTALGVGDVARVAASPEPVLAEADCESIRSPSVRSASYSAPWVS